MKLKLLIIGLTAVMLSGCSSENNPDNPNTITEQSRPVKLIQNKSTETTNH